MDETTQLAIDACTALGRAHVEINRLTDIIRQMQQEMQLLYQREQMLAKQQSDTGGLGYTGPRLHRDDDPPGILRDMAEESEY